MPNQLAIIGSPDLYAQAARKILQLLPASCIAAENLFLESVKRSLTPPPPSSQVSSSTDPPPLLTSSPLHSGNQLERPIPIHHNSTTPTKTPLTNLPVLQTQPTNYHATSPASVVVGSGTNPFDDPLPTTNPRSRSGSDASTSSLVSMSSVSSSTAQAMANGGPDPARPTKQTSSLPVAAATSSPSNNFRFDFVPPELAYFNCLSASRKAIKKCVVSCQCWSSVYDKCIVSKEMLLEEINKKMKKSLEMEDISSVQIHVTSTAADGRDRERSSSAMDEDEDPPPPTFRSRSTTLAAASHSKRTTTATQNHDRLHSHRLLPSEEEENSETRMVAGMHHPHHSTLTTTSGHAQNRLDLPYQPLRRSGTVSGGSRPPRRTNSPRSSPVLERRASPSYLFEDRVGLFLKIVLDKLMDMMSHPPTVNILLTRLISRLAHYPQPLLRSLLLNHQLVLKPGIPNLLMVNSLFFFSSFLLASWVARLGYIMLSFLSLSCRFCNT